MRAFGRFAVSVLLGFPAALIAHTVAFGDGHVAGGSSHAALIDAAIACTVVGTAGVLAAALRRANGTPYLGTVALAAGAALAALEASESPHAIPIAVCIAALAFSAALIYAAARVFSTTVSAVAAAVVTRTTIARTMYAQFGNALLHLKDADWRFELFSRPPPALS